MGIHSMFLSFKIPKGANFFQVAPFLAASNYINKAKRNILINLILDNCIFNAS